MSAPAVRLEEVTRRYAGAGSSPSFTLAIPTLVIPRAAWTVVTGRSGAGKTTLLHILATLDRPDTGNVHLLGRDVTRDSEGALARVRRDRMGIVYQRFYFAEHWTVWENVSCRLIPAGVPARIRRARAEAALDALGIAALADRLPREISGGEQQRAAVARAVISEPDILVADEPTSNVDAETAERIVACFRRLRGRGSAVVIATHDPALVEAADVHYVLEQGRLRG